jgi:predicted dinucleotide-binding enzyme
MNRIGVIGSGDVGKALSLGFAERGYEVFIGSRDSYKLDEWKLENNNNIRTGTFEDSARFGDIIILAVKGSAALNALKLADINNFENKVVIDVTNPIDDTVPPVNGVLKFFINSNESLMELLQKQAPKAKFVKAFNSIGYQLMVKPDFKRCKPTMFICGDDYNAKDEVMKILEDFGWSPEDMGKANAAGAIESLCILWCLPGFNKNDWSHAFKLLKKV